MNGDPAQAIGQIIVPEGYTNLAEQAFNSLYHLESITFPSTLEIIPQYCCEDCTNLTSIGFSEGNRAVGYGAFTRCTALSAVELSRGLTNLEADAFYNCTNLTSVVLSPDYVGGTSGSYQFYNCPIAKLEIPASCQGFGYQSLNRTKALRFLGDLPSWNVYNANYQYAQLIEYPATNTTWNAGPIANYSTKPHKGFVGPVAAFDVTDAYFWTNVNETVTFAYAESPLAETVTLPEGTISWGGADWEVVGFEPNAFAGQPTTTIYYPISEYAKWEQVTPSEGITLAPVPGTFFTLTFYVNGGDPFVPSQMTFPPSSQRALPSAAPTKSAYKFLGWATAADGAVAYQPGDAYTAGAAGGSATLFAKWEEVGNYTLKYVTGAPYVDPPADREVAVGSTVQIAADVLVRTGWTFDGWTNSVGALYAPGADFTSDTAKDGTAYLYAKWTSKSGSASWTDDEGTKWHYGFNGDSLWITSVDPAPGITELPDPLTFVIGGTKVTQVNTGAVPAYVDGLWWRYQELDDNEAKLLGTILSGPTDLVLPSVIAGRTVTAFVAVDNGFVNTKSYITSVEIPGTVKIVPTGAFQYCYNLKSVVLHEGVEALRDNVFLYDNALATPIDFPSTLTDVSAYAFQNACENMPYDANGLQFADTGKTYLLRARTDADYVPEGVKTVANSAFANTTCTKITLPESVTKYGGYLFSGAENLEEVVFLSPASISSGGLLSGVSTIKTVTFYGGAQNLLIGTVPSGITTVGFLTTPPAWDVKTTFPDATTVVYDARYAAEWAEYAESHPEFEYVEEMTEVPVGDYVKYDLEQDLGIVIGDYDKNEKVSVKGLPSGLKLVATKQTKKDKKKTVTNVVYTVEGVPTAACDFTQQPVYAVVTSGGKTTWQPIILSVAPQAVTDLDPLALGESVTTNACEWLPGVTNGWSVSGLPDGLKYTSKAIYSGTGKKKALKYPAYTVYGKTTKAGLFTITAKKKVSSYYETLKYRVLVEPKAVDAEIFPGLVDVVATAYESYSNAVPAAVDKVSGLPAGLAFAAKDVYAYANAKKKTGKYVKQAAQTIVGTPTKPGTYVVTYTKNVKSGKKTVAKTAQILWTVLPSPVVPTADFNVSGGIVLNRNAGSNYGTDGAAMNFSVTPGSSVSASGLPNGLSLKQISDGTWAIVGTPSKTGTSYVTVTVKLNGNTVKQSVAIQVSAHPLAGNYSGEIWAADDSYLGTAQLTVSSVGKVSLSLVEKGVKTSATLSKVMAVEEDPMKPQAGKWKCVFSLKADKKKILPKRTLTLVFKRKLGEWELPTCYSESYTTSADAMFGDLELHRTLSKAEIAARVEAGRIPALPSVETVAILAGERGLSAGEPVATGEVVVVSAVYKASAAAYTVTGRLPDGKTFSASSPVLWWGKADDSHDSLKMNTIAVSNGSGKQYLLGVYLPYGATSPESELQWCWYRQCWGDGQEWCADTFYGIFGDDWVALPGTVSAALGVEPGEALPLSLLWRAAELPGEAVEEGPYLFKVTEKTVTEKKKKVTKHYASVSADDGATWTTSKNPISWTAGRAAFNVTLNGFDYAFDLALDHSGELTGWAKKSHTVKDKKGKTKTVVDAVGAAVISDTSL